MGIDRRYFAGYPLFNFRYPGFEQLSLYPQAAKVQPCGVHSSADMVLVAVTLVVVVVVVVVKKENRNLEKEHLTFTCSIYRENIYHAFPISGVFYPKVRIRVIS